jgi:hypothetical protein
MSGRMGLNNDIGGPAWKYEHTHDEREMLCKIFDDRPSWRIIRRSWLQGRLFCTAIFLIARLNYIYFHHRDFAAIALGFVGVSYV